MAKVLLVLYFYGLLSFTGTVAAATWTNLTIEPRITTTNATYLNVIVMPGLIAGRIF